MIRRQFNKLIGAGTLSTLIPSRALWEMKKVGKIGIQLYTVRDAMAEDPIGTLKAIAAMGYDDVEVAGYDSGKYYGMAPKEFKQVLDDLGLSVKSGHTLTGARDKNQIGTPMNQFERYAADAASIGQDYIVLAYLDDSERERAEQYQGIAELLNTCGTISKEYGVKMAYHNHDFEFYELDGKVPYDILLAETDPDIVDMELDLYWIKKAEKSTKKYFENHAGRFALWHVKDMDKTEEQFFTEVGNGIIDFQEIFKCKKKAGMQHFYVEQDTCKNHLPIESVKISIDYLKGMRY
jgi:sugar phosphate isomerase/epimerase